MHTRSRLNAVLIFALALAVLLTAAWLAYRPGITGAFLFDDFSSLKALAATGPVVDWGSFWRYVTSGTADPTGRPLSLLSFLLDAQIWPASPQPFKYTNILLHLLNGALLCWVMLKLARLRGIEGRWAAAAAVIGAGIWLLHPLFVSTTLYVVQREAMLSATFTFIGFLCWCAGRDAFETGATRRAIAWMVSGAWLCTLLATMSKANGVLLPLLLVVAECTVLRMSKQQVVSTQRTRRIASVVLLGVPVVLLAAYLIHALPGAIQSAESNRPWTVDQRLLSEPRILTEYLRMLWVPQTTSFGVFYDQVRASSDWLHPWTTLPCVILVIGLLGFGWLARRRFPLATFAILFFFAAQLLESSFIPLELAFEHRNYLSAAFMFWPIATWLTAPRERRLAGRISAALVLCVLGVMTWTRAGVWGNVQMQARLWGRINPDSPQAQTFSASVEAATGNLTAAIGRMREAGHRMPDQPQIALTLISMECNTGATSPESWQAASYALSHTDNGWNNIANWFITTAPDATRHRCEGLTVARLNQTFAALKSNPRFAQFHRHDRAFQRAAAIVDLASRRPDQALVAFDAAHAGNPSPSAVLEQAKALDAFGYPDLALRHLDRYKAFRSCPMGIGMPRIHAWVLHEQGWWPQETARLRKTLERDAAAKRNPDGNPAKPSRAAPAVPNRPSHPGT